MKRLLGVALCLAALHAVATDWPSDPRSSGTAFLPLGLQALQADATNSPVTLWLDKGKALWAERGTQASCQSCHGDLSSLNRSAASFPRMAPDGKSLINLEDQIIRCRARTNAPNTSSTKPERWEDDAVLALSAVLHNAAVGETIDVKPPLTHATEWQARLLRGTQLYATRLGRINLACVHCHDQNIGKSMRADVVSPGNPTGFPIYRMSWQRLGSIDRRLRACYSGVQASLPPAGDQVLRELELYLKVRANGLPVEGPSIRR